VLSTFALLFLLVRENIKKNLEFDRKSLGIFAIFAESIPINNFCL